MPKKHVDADMTDTDYEDLLNTVQRHTRCSSAYCLKRKEMTMNQGADLTFQ